MDTSGIITFCNTLLTAMLAIAAAVCAVSLAASGFMYFGVVGHNTRAMDTAQTGARAAIIGLVLVWGAKEIVNLLAGAAGQPGLH